MIWMLAAAVALADAPSLGPVLAGDEAYITALAESIGIDGLDAALAALEPAPAASGRVVQLQDVPGDSVQGHRVRDLRLAQDGAGVLHAAWVLEWMTDGTDHIGNSRQWHHEIWWAQRSPEGTWSAPASLGQGLQELRLLVDRDETVWLLEGGLNGNAEHDFLGLPPGHYDIRVRQRDGARWGSPRSLLDENPDLLHGFDAAFSPDDQLHLVWVPWFRDGLQNNIHHKVVGEDAVSRLAAPAAAYTVSLNWSGRQPVLHAIVQDTSRSRESLVSFPWRGERFHSGAVVRHGQGFELTSPSSTAAPGWGIHAPHPRHGTVWVSHGPGGHMKLPLGTWEGSHGRARAALGDDVAAITFGGAVYLLSPRLGEWQASLLRAPVRHTDSRGVADLFEDVWRVGVQELADDTVVVAWGSAGGEVAVWEGPADVAGTGWREATWQSTAGSGLTTAQRAWIGERLLEAARQRPSEEAACLRAIVAEGLGNSGGPGYYAREALRGRAVPGGCPAQAAH